MDLMKKNTLSIVLALMILAALSSCFHFNDHDISISISDDDDEYWMQITKEARHMLYRFI